MLSENICLFGMDNAFTFNIIINDCVYVYKRVVYFLSIPFVLCFFYLSSCLLLGYFFKLFHFIFFLDLLNMPKYFSFQYGLQYATMTALSNITYLPI